MTHGMNVPILRDSDVASFVSMNEAVEVIEAALARKAEGRFLTPPRHALHNEQGSLIFSIGGDGKEGVVGFRTYHSFPGQHRLEQLTAVYDASSGELKGVVLGSLLGELRTGALGGIAIRRASRTDAATLAIVGAGRQARTQLAAAVAVRRFNDVRVYSRRPENRERFASEMEDQLGIQVRPVTSAGQAVRGADVVIAATNSSAPVVRADLIEPGTHVTTVGPKLADAHEIDVAIADRASAIFTDSPEQVRSYGAGFFLAGTPHMERMTDLAEHVAGRPLRVSDDDVTLYCSAGLSGTAVVLADLVLSRRRSA